MEVSVNTQNNFHILTLSGSLDALSAPQLDDAGTSLQAQSDTTHVILCMDAVDYISSAGLRSVLGLAKALRKRQRQLLFAALTPAVKEVFDISGFSSYFKEFPSLEQALAAKV